MHVLRVNSVPFFRIQKYYYYHIPWLLKMMTFYLLHSSTLISYVLFIVFSGRPDHHSPPPPHPRFFFFSMACLHPILKYFSSSITPSILTRDHSSGALCFPAPNWTVACLIPSCFF